MTAIRTLLLLFVLAPNVRSWETFELEIFDVVEEVNRNFYEFMEISQDAPSSDVKRAYRKLSLQLHPDKNDAPDASVQFRNLVSIYEILKDEKKRSRYDKVLVEGLPNWRNPLYYYRRYRKMGTLETSLWLIILTSFIQYAVYVAAYWEKKFEIREVLGSKVKKNKKQSKKKQNQSEDEIDIIEEEIRQIPKPSVWDLLPFQFARFCIWTAKTIPTLPGLYRASLEEKRKRLEQEAADAREREEEERKEKELEAERKQRRKKTYKLEERTGDDGTYTNQETEIRNGSAPVREVPVITGGFWTDDDISELARLMKKFPPGTQARWEKIAEMMNRTVAEVTKVANREKNNLYRSGAKIENVAEEEEEPLQEEQEVVETKKKVKTKGGKFAQEATTNAAAMDSNWSQKQQRALESALGEYPKGCLERWEKIAKAVPGKTKEDCMLRVRYLAEIVRKKKEEEERKAAEAESAECQDGQESAIQ